MICTSHVRQHPEVRVMVHLKAYINAPQPGLAIIGCDVPVVTRNANASASLASAWAAFVRRSPAIDGSGERPERTVTIDNKGKPKTVDLERNRNFVIKNN